MTDTNNKILTSKYSSLLHTFLMYEEFLRLLGEEKLNDFLPAHWPKPELVFDPSMSDCSEADLIRTELDEALRTDFVKIDRCHFIKVDDLLSVGMGMYRAFTQGIIGSELLTSGNCEKIRFLHATYAKMLELMLTIRKACQEFLYAASSVLAEYSDHSKTIYYAKWDIPDNYNECRPFRLVVYRRW